MNTTSGPIQLVGRRRLILANPDTEDGKHERGRRRPWRRAAIAGDAPGEDDQAGPDS